MQPAIYQATIRLATHNSSMQPANHRSSMQPPDIHLFSYPTSHPSVPPAIHLPIHRSNVHPSIDTAIPPSSHQSILLSSHLSFFSGHRSIISFFPSANHASSIPSIDLSISDQSSHPSIHEPSNQSFNQPFKNFFVEDKCCRFSGAASAVEGAN